jgi:hypothetical protein
MIGSLSGRTLVVASITVALVGALDGVRGGNADLVAVFLIVAALQAVLLARLQFGRRPVALRSDLTAWLDERAALTGEPAEWIADRCVAEHRSMVEVVREEHSP